MEVLFFQMEILFFRRQNSILYEVKLKNINLWRNFYILKRKNYNFNRALEKFEKIFKQ